MPVLDARPGHLDAYYRAGDPFTVTLTGPAGWLDDRTFTATLDGVALSVTELDDELIVVASAIVTAAADGVGDFVLSVAGDAVLVGLWLARNDGSAHGDLDAAVIIDDVSVDVTILGPTGTGPGGGGGQVDAVGESTGIDVDSSNPANPVISAAPAIATAAADATSKANAAQAAAEAYADSIVEGGTGGVVDTIAESTGITVDDTDPSNPAVSAAPAIATAAADATTKANAAQSAAIAAASSDATTKANAAQAAAISSAATDATTKANAAQSAATSAAATDATTKANAAQSAATAAAATDATTKANAAQAAAISAAATDATTKANTAETDANDYTDDQLAALGSLVADDPTEVDLATVGTVTTLTVESSIARTAAVTAEIDADVATALATLPALYQAKSVFVRRTTDHAGVISDATTFVSSGLTVALEASTVYEVSGLVVYTGAAAARIRFGWTIPSGAAGAWHAIGHRYGSTAIDTQVPIESQAWSATLPLGIPIDATIVVAHFRGLIVVGTAGNLDLLYRQGVSTATATVVKAHSYLRAIPVG